MDPLKIVHISDLHIGNSGRELVATRHLVHHICSNHPNAVVCLTGDVVHNASAREFSIAETALKPIKKHCQGLVVCPGNHDVRALGVGATDSTLYRMFERRVAFGMPEGVACLDSTTGGYLAQGQVGYSQRTLLGKTGGARVVMVHHHPFDRGLGLELKDSEELLSLLSGRCHLMLFGHKHVSAIWRDVYGIDWIAASGKSTDDLAYRVFELDSDDRVTYIEEKL